MSETQGPGPPDREEPDEPIPELAALREAPSRGFRARIRGSIHRRLFASEALDFSLLAFFDTFLTYLLSIFQMVLGKSPDQERQSE